ncbi:MAG: AAA family ATPase [Gammaproteobacteria bacterium]|nr:AAA family ATPase [Gammaproteobacteria bacterium]NIV49653.1 AAA family ATPase [Gammaproteobacteria bacterium]NIW57051.1 AAA family ATPase [Gammaproteobacteria bacterium]
MECLHCQHDNPPEAKFCLECGAAMSLVCRHCDTQLPATAKFCLECGEAVHGSDVEQPAHKSPAAYTPEHLAQRIRATKDALAGERKQVTVLFADVKGSTELIANRDPEEADSLLKPVLDCMMEAVHRYEGTVSRVTGDGVMALFGAPIAHEDHALRACYASLAMQRAVQREMERIRRERGVTVQIRVGLNSGEVVVRNIGNDLFMEYSAMGESAHLAARMEQLAAPGTTLLSEQTLKLVEGLIEVRALGLVPVKGIAEPQPVYELLGASSTKAQLHTASVIGLSPFVGRRKELEILARSLDRAGEGHGQVVGVVGEPGIGKTRLFHEFSHWPRTRKWLLLETEAVSYGQTIAYLPIIRILRNYFGIEDRDDARRIREKLSGKLVTLDENLVPTLPALMTLFDIPVEDPAWLALDPPARREQTLDAIKRLLLRESQVQPICIIAENLHWIDSESQLLLNKLVDGLPGANILFLANYRPEYQHEWGGLSYYTQLRLDPLSSENIEDFLARLLGSDAGLAPLKKKLIERTSGNPFFLEESVRSLVESGALVGERGAYEAAEKSPDIEVPATVQAVLAARLDRLKAEHKRLLQTAAVIGTDVPFSLLEAVARVPEQTLQSALASLRSAEFLYEASLFPQIEYAFKHALTHEVAYGTLLKEHRRSLHARIVDAIEELHGDQIGEHVEQLAYHAVRGEQWERAVTYLRRASIKAVGRNAYREAIEGLEQARKAVRHLPQDPKTLEQGIDILLELRSSLQALGEHERVFESLEEAEKLASSLGDRDRLGWASAYLSQYLWRMGDPTRAEALDNRALGIAVEQEDFALEAVTRFFLSQGFFNVGAYSPALEHSRKTVEVLQGESVYQTLGLTGLPSVLSRTYVAWSLAELGEFDEAIRSADEAVAIAESKNQPYSMASAYLANGQFYLLRGVIEEAIRWLERALGICRTWNLRAILPTTTELLGLAYALNGQLDEALQLTEESRSLAGSIRIFDTPLAITAASMVLLLCGEQARAAQAAAQVLELTSQRGLRGSHARALYTSAMVNANAESPDTKRAHGQFVESLTLAGELGMLPLVAQCHQGFGLLLRCTQRVEEAEVHLEKAAKLFQSMVMPHGLAQSERACAPDGRERWSAS